MPQTPSSVTRTAAARTVAAPRRELGNELDRYVDDLLALVAEVRRGACNHAAVEQHIAEGERIAAGIRAVFRGGAEPRPCNPPLFLSRDGRTAGW